MILAQAQTLKGPPIDWAALSPILAVLIGAVVVLMVGLLRPRFAREHIVPFLSFASLATSLGLTIWQLDSTGDIISGALRIDGLSTVLTLLFVVTGMAVVIMAWRHVAPRESAHGEFHALLLTSIGGMLVLAWSQNLVALFVGFELLSIPLYVLCATEMRRSTSLESGLKYLIVGSVGSATLLYGLALVYGATGSTDFSGISRAIDEQGLATDTLLLGGIAFTVVGLCFKASVAPFHQWTPDVYEGAPTPVTAFMAVATKAAAFGVLLRMFDVALIDAQPSWGPLLAALAAVTIIVGNVGALGQTSIKRLLAWSSVAQAGYMLAGVVVSTSLGVRATVFYLATYLLMNLAAFAVIAARERETEYGDDITALQGLGASRPVLAWAMTFAMLSLAGIPATAGFIGKVFLIRATVDGGYTWLGIVIVVGSMISLAYYLRVVAAMWMRTAPTPESRSSIAAPAGPRPALAGGAPEGDARGPITGPRAHGSVTMGFDDEEDLDGPGRRGAAWVLTALAAVFGIATVVLGIVPQPLFELVERCGEAFTNLV
jgi:NADH-quinone oxidoreductase subunit N